MKYVGILIPLLWVCLSCGSDDPNPNLGIIVFDKSGNQYSTVQIGNQVWLTSNLKTTKLNDDSNILTTPTPTTDISGESTPSYQWAYQGGNEIVTSGTGLLFTWHLLADSKGVCPPGFRIPAESDWDELSTFLGGNQLAGGKLKSTSSTFWNAPNTGATNESGFNGLPGGMRQPNGVFLGQGDTGFYWTSTSVDSQTAVAYAINNQSGSLVKTSYNKSNGLNCRCIKN